MKLTFEVPNDVAADVEAQAAARGQSVDAYLASVVQERVAAEKSAQPEKPWMRFAGMFKDYPEDTRRINEAIEEEFERIHPEDWR
ncbi:MAG: hypothetical protein Q7P63_01870 [Verrucomicrobiota bacterium JB022]|nr:hypothetical protein [Verrucomicrobiota bacterium JB022]